MNAMGFRLKSLGKMLLTTVVLSSVCLSACGKAGPSTKEASEKEKAAPTNISIMTTFTTTEPPGDDNVIVKEVEKRTNTKLKLNWVSSYDDKMNVTLASGDIPDLMYVTDTTPVVVQMIAQGAFWDLTPFLKDYPNLMKFPKTIWDNSKTSGKNYGIPRVRPLEGFNTLPIIRKDWLDKLNLKVPETMDDLYMVMKEFTEKDVNGSGKKDTIGLSGYVSASDMGGFRWVENVYNGTNGKWKLQNNQLVNMELEPGTRQSLVWLNKAYTEGLIPKDFAVMKTSQADDLVKAGKAGMVMGSLQSVWLIQSELIKTNPQAKIYALTYLNGPFGKIATKEKGFIGMYMIPKSVPEAKVMKILQFMDYGASDEGSDLASNGFKGVHYNEVDGYKVATEQATKDNVSFNAFGQIFMSYDKYSKAYITGTPKDIYENNKKIIDERERFSIGPPAIGLISDTYLKVGKEFDKKIQDMKVKVVMGKEPMSSWDNLVSQLKNDADFQKITKEMNEAYNKREGK